MLTSASNIWLLGPHLRWCSCCVVYSPEVVAQYWQWMLKLRRYIARHNDAYEVIFSPKAVFKPSRDTFKRENLYQSISRQGVNYCIMKRAAWRRTAIRTSRYRRSPSRFAWLYDEMMAFKRFSIDWNKYNDLSELLESSMSDDADISFRSNAWARASRPPGFRFSYVWFYSMP